MNTPVHSPPVRRLALAALPCLLVLLWIAAPRARAGDDAYAEEIAGARQEHAELVAQASAFEEAGRLEEAAALRAKAAKLAQAIERSVAEHQAGAGEGARGGSAEREQRIRELGKALEGLGRGMDALRRLRRMDALEMLERVAHDVKREIAELEEAGRREARADRHAPDEFEERMRLLRKAADAYRETERLDAVERMEFAIHAQELAHAARRDEEARGVLERAPRGEELAKLLVNAGEFWQQRGHERDSAALFALAKQLLADARSARARGKSEPATRERDQDEVIRQLTRELEKTRARLEELARELDRIARNGEERDR